MTRKILKKSFKILKFTIKNVIRSLFFICLVFLISACIGWFVLVKYFNAHNLGQIIVNGLQEHLASPVVIK